MEQARDNPTVATGEGVKSKKHVILETQKRQTESPLYYTAGHMSPQECGVETQTTEVQRQSRAPW